MFGWCRAIAYCSAASNAGQHKGSRPRQSLTRHKISAANQEAGQQAHPIRCPAAVRNLVAKVSRHSATSPWEIIDIVGCCAGVSGKRYAWVKTNIMGRLE